MCYINVVCTFYLTKSVVGYMPVIVMCRLRFPNEKRVPSSPCLSAERRGRRGCAGTGGSYRLLREREAAGGEVADSNDRKTGWARPGYLFRMRKHK